MLFRKMTLFFFLILFSMASCQEPEPEPNPIEDVLKAKAGPDQQVKVGENVKLDGSSSSHSQNKSFTFKWKIINKPSGSSVNLTGASTAKPTFIADVAGEYELELTISNDNGKSQDKLLVTASHIQPLTLGELISEATILEDRIDDPNTPDYIAPKTLVVAAQLTIKPGVTIAFDADTRFDINAEGGVIIAKGEANKKIRFTGKEQKKGYWRGMVIFSNDGANELEYVEISYAGSNQTLSTIKAGLTLFGTGQAQVSITNSSLSYNDGYGLHAANGSVLKSFINNTFSNNSEAGILLAADNVKRLDAASVFSSSNGRNKVEVMQSTVSDASQSEVVWAGFTDKTPYRILGGLQVTTGWKLQPGVTLEVASDQLLVIEDTGYLNAVGTATDKIVITGAEQKAGFWRGIATNSASVSNKLEQVEISYGGSNQLVSGKKANIALVGNQANFTIKNSKISGSAGYGVYGRYNTKINSDVLTTNTFENNAQSSVFMEDATGEMPSEILGKWMMGHFSMGEFWNYDGSFVGNAFELAVAFNFKADGQLEFYFISGGTSYGCRTEALVYKKGTVVFNKDSSFTFTPTEGSARGFYKGCAPSYKNYNRQYEKSELQPETYYYTLEKDSNGKEQLVTRFKKEDTNKSYFNRTNW